MLQSTERLPLRGGSWLRLVLWLIIVAAIAALGSSITLPKIPGWYASLAKPSFTPSNAAFGPVWTVLYIMMAIAVWRIDCTPSPNRKWAVMLFCLQLALNAIWSPVFFGLEAPRMGLAVIVALLLSLAATILAFWRVDRVAAWLLVPYLAWVCYASALNVAIVALN